MNLTINQIYQGFKLVEEQVIEEIQGVARHFYHEKSGANLIALSNEDPHKVFSITFKTPPQDNSGVAHILEHAVCCASEKYPLKDTFVELDKGSLNTTMNACTYKDMTMFYCASQNEQDLLNLMDVYMDLVFHPLIASRPYIFKQEGWHYALEELDDELTYNGIVYNEMKGEYDEPGTLLDHIMHKNLFPDTLYQYDSGGIPESIVGLSEEAFHQYYQTYYKSANSTMYLYGDGDLLKQLQLLDEMYLKDLEKEAVEITIPTQNSFLEPIVTYAKYPLDDLEEGEEKTILSLGFVVGETIEFKERIAFQVLEHMLLKSAASPLAEVLMGEEGLGKVLEEGGYDTGKKQPTFSITLHGTTADAAKAFEERIFDTLGQMVREGIEQDLLEASLATITFALQEGDTPWEPKGLMYCEEILTNRLYGGKNFESLNYKKVVEEVLSLAREGYFEKIIATYFLNNPHRQLVVLEPSEQLAKEQEKRLRKQLKKAKRSMTKQMLRELLVMNQELDQIQETQNTKEQLSCLPTLHLEDLEKVVKPQKLYKEKIGKANLIYHPLETQEIVYMHVLFDTLCVKEEDLPYIGLLANTLTYLSTENFTYQALENEINKQTGGLNCSINAYANCEDTDQYRPLFKISAKVLKPKFKNLLELLTEILTQGSFHEQTKLKEIILSIHYEMERSFISSPEYRGVRRVYSYFSTSAMYEDQVSGMAYYEFLTDLCEKFEEKAELIGQKLEMLYKQIFLASHMTISISAPDEDYRMCKESLIGWCKQIPDGHVLPQSYELVPCELNEGYITSSSVQAIIKGFNFRKAGFPFKGNLGIVSNILNSSYLWDKVRLQGGAYGCDMSISSDGNLVICSYSDPELQETLKAYEGIAQFLSQVALDQEELNKYIIGTIGSLDLPLTTEQKSEKALAYELCHVTHEMLQQERNEILQAKPEDILEFVDLFKSFAKAQTVCVIGSEQAILKEKHLFKRIKKL